MSHWIRIELPDVPGSLGSVASEIGLAGGNIEAIEMMERRQDGTALDDIFLDLEPGVLPDMVVSAIQRVEGARVLWVSRYAAAGSLHLDLEAVELVTQEPQRAVDRLVEVLPHTFRSDWAMLATVLDDTVKVITSTQGAPELPAECRDWFPLNRALRPEIPAHWPSWGSTVVAAAPVGDGGRVVLFARRGGPEIIDSELARLSYLVSLTASIEAAAR